MDSKQVASAINAVAAIAEAIRSLSSVPSGELYARTCGHLTLEAFTSIVGVLKRAGLVAETNHVLTWVGPELEGKP